MSDWNHVICNECWRIKSDGRRPHRVTASETLPCCWCGAKTRSGIWLRANPAETNCRAVGPTHEGEW